MPFIVVTALDDLSSKVQCLQVGADDYITKPFDSMDLLARVGAVLAPVQAPPHVPQCQEYQQWTRTCTVCLRTERR